MKNAHFPGKIERIGIKQLESMHNLSEYAHFPKL